MPATTCAATGSIAIGRAAIAVYARYGQSFVQLDRTASAMRPTVSLNLVQREMKVICQALSDLWARPHDSTAGSSRTRRFARVPDSLVKLSIVSLGETAIAAGEIQERLAALVFAGHESRRRRYRGLLREDLDDPAIDKRQAVSQDRRGGAAVVIFRPVKSFGPGVANRREISSWSSRKMFTAKQRFFLR